MLNQKVFQQHLQEAVAFHGHLCVGQVIGVRLAMLGLELVGITDPLGADRKKLIVFVEIGRCATDAIMTVTGARVGRRSLKVIDYGKLAATFFNLETGEAFRIFSRDDAEGKALARYPDLDEKQAQIRAYRELTNAELFDYFPVRVRIRDENMPGSSTRKVRCDICGEFVLDSRDIAQNGQTLCRPCASGKPYYEVDHRPPKTMQKAVGQ